MTPSSTPESGLWAVCRSVDHFSMMDATCGFSTLRIRKPVRFTPQKRYGSRSMAIRSCAREGERERERERPRESHARASVSAKAGIYVQRMLSSFMSERGRGEWRTEAVFVGSGESSIDYYHGSVSQCDASADGALIKRIAAWLQCSGLAVRGFPALTSGSLQQVVPNLWVGSTLGGVVGNC